MIAERQASIEGRLYFEAKYAGKEPSARIPELAEREFTKHQAQTKKIANELSKEHTLSKIIATHCAKNILRYKEIYGENPSENQISTLVHIAKDLENSYPYKEGESAKLTFLHRNEGDLLFRQMSTSRQSLNSLDINRIQAQAKTHLESTTVQIARDLEKSNQREMVL